MEERAYLMSNILSIWGRNKHAYHVNMFLYVCFWNQAKNGAFKILLGQCTI